MASLHDPRGVEEKARGVIMTVETTVIESEVTQMVEVAPVFARIETLDDANKASEYLKKVREIRKRIAEFFRPDIDAAHKLHKSLMAKMNTIDDAPAGLESAYKRLLADWQNREQARIREEQEKRDAAARRAAQAQAILEGDSKLAKGIASGAVAVASTSVVKPLAKIAGVSSKQLWRAEVVDKLALVKAIAAGQFPLDWIDLDMSSLNAVIRSTKGVITIPGVKAIQETSIAARS